MSLCQLLSLLKSGDAFVCLNWIMKKVLLIAIKLYPVPELLKKKKKKISVRRTSDTWYLVDFQQSLNSSLYLFVFPFCMDSAGRFPCPSPAYSLAGSQCGL